LQVPHNFVPLHYNPQLFEFFLQFRKQSQGHHQNVLFLYIYNDDIVDNAAHVLHVENIVDIAEPVLQVDDIEDKEW
jgi:hypothetical protein